MTARLILLHGWTMRGAAMAPLAEALPGFDCDMPDLPGHGDRPGATVDDAVEMLGGLLGSAAPCVLVGWSLGALVAWRWLGENAPGPVRGMISLDMSPRPMPAPGWDHAMTGQSADSLRARAGWFRGNWASAVDPIAAGIFAAPDHPLLPKTRAMIAAQNPAAMADCWESLIEQDCRDVVARLPVPLLAIHGAQSRVYPPDCARWLADTAPQGRALVVQGAGHAPHLDQTAETATAIASFIRDLLP